MGIGPDKMFIECLRDECKLGRQTMKDFSYDKKNNKINYFDSVQRYSVTLKDGDIAPRNMGDTIDWLKCPACKNYTLVKG